MPVLSVDLACRSWSDLGVVLLEQKGPLIACEILRWNEPYPPPVVELALRLNQICIERDAGVLMLDGPQAWKSEEYDPAVQTASPASTPGILPGSYERFVGYCLALYDALGRLGWQRLTAREQPGNSSTPRKILAESYPQAAWKSLGIAPLPPRQLRRVSHLAESYAALSQLLPITTSQPPNYNQLQAIVGGLPGLAIEDRNHTGKQPEQKIVAPQPVWENGQWLKGLGGLDEFIVQSVVPQPATPWLTPE